MSQPSILGLWPLAACPYQMKAAKGALHRCLVALVPAHIQGPLVIRMLARVGCVHFFP